MMVVPNRANLPVAPRPKAKIIFFPYHHHFVVRSADHIQKTSRPTIQLVTGPTRLAIRRMAHDSFLEEESAVEMAKGI